MRRVLFHCADSVIVTTCRQCYQQPVQLHCCINERYQTEKELQHHRSHTPSWHAREAIRFGHCLLEA
jgi:hypothetical protein